MKNRKNNKGFSLVELIVVVAIMAVLVGVLAPAYLRYVEKTRLQKDNSAIGEICAALQTAMADEECFNEAAGADSAVVATLTAADGKLVYKNALTNLEAEAKEVVSEYELTSKQYKASGYAITIVVHEGKIYVAGFVDDAGDTATTAFAKADVTDATKAAKMGLYPNGLKTSK